MSTLTSEPDKQILHSEDDLSNYFQRFSKTPEKLRVGIEAEFLGVNKVTGKALPYYGDQGIEAILKALAERFGYQKLEEQGHVISLKRDDIWIALEPGGQIELSAPPVYNLFEVEDQIHLFTKELREVTEKLNDISLLGVGMHPFSELDDIEWVPKKRYDIMATYMGRHGSQSHEMMKRTATNQINFDYLSEENAMMIFRVALGITSIVTAMFANSALSSGKPNGFMTRRLDIWNHTDESRAGLLTEFTRPGKKFSDYLNYILEMPMIFIIREGRWLPVDDLNFRQYIERGYQGHQATLGDFELHLSTAFPEVRLKQYMEVRGADCQEPALIPAVGAFWKGILYCEETAKKAWDLVAYASTEDRILLHHEVTKRGLLAKLGGQPILPIARELVELSCKSLAKQKKKETDRDECEFLERIREKITRPGKSPGRQLIEKWQGEFGEDPKKLLDYLSI